MSATLPSPRRTPVPPRPAHLGALRDTLAIGWRNYITYRRVPTLLVFTLIQPVVFVLLFRYVFGGAITVPGGITLWTIRCRIFVQTVAFGATNTAIGLATDAKSGLLERFHSLPMARSAVLTGRTFADLGRNVIVVALMAVVGFIVGFRAHGGVPGFVTGILLVLLFAYSFSWIFATVGLAIRDPESAQAAVFPALAPIVSAVPLCSCPSAPCRAGSRPSPTTSPCP